MSDGVSFDFSEILNLVADLGDADKRIIPNVRKAVEVSAHKADEMWEKDAKSLNPGHAKKYPKKVSYDLILDKDGSIGAEIGPTLGGQGSLGLIDAPQGTSARVAKAIERDFEAGIAKATEDLL